MLGFAGLAVLSLVWVGHRRGRFGRKSSALLRTALPIVLGLGGWFAGVLVVLTTMPAVPLDSELLGILSIAAPIALGIFWVWVDRRSTARAKTTGIAVAVIGAVAGAWFGFHAVAGLFAVVTTIVGTTAGTNLGLIALDVVRAREVREVASVRSGVTPAAA